MEAAIRPGTPRLLSGARPPAIFGAVRVIDPAEQHRRRPQLDPTPRRATRQALAYDLYGQLGSAAAVAERMATRKGTVLVYLCRERQARALFNLAAETPQAVQGGH